MQKMVKKFGRGNQEGGGGVQFEILTHILKDNIKTDFKKMRNSVDCLSLIPSKQL
jgi:hypothetical protein